MPLMSVPECHRCRKLQLCTMYQYSAPCSGRASVLSVQALVLDRLLEYSKQSGEERRPEGSPGAIAYSWRTLRATCIAESTASSFVISGCS